MKRTAITVACLAAVLWGGTAEALTPREKCLDGRYTAKSRYEACVNKWLGNFSHSTNYERVRTDLAQCRIKYARAWDKLSTLATVPCFGSRYMENFNGTITDNLTGLVWEKKSDDASAHDYHTQWTWSTASPFNGNGTSFTNFLGVAVSSLNQTGFAGTNDWRLPTFSELLTILLPEYPCTAPPCVDALFNYNYTPGCTVTACSLTSGNQYWSATAYADDPSNAWLVDFFDAFVDLDPKTNSYYVRAVRGGL